MAVQIEIRRDTAANWTAVNPLLTQGEFGFETDTKKLKIGDGVTLWNALSYLIGGPSVSQVTSGAGPPVGAPATSPSIYFDENTGAQYNYYAGAWH